MSEKIATRQAYGKALAELGADPRIVVMDADLSKSTNTATFQKAYPERFINTGIAEANMMSTAAGLASCGKIVFASSFAMFAAERAFEQVRNSIAYPHLNVKIAASHAGVTVGEDGATHQCLEDLALMRTLPGMVVLNPADATETRAAIRAAAAHDGPVYIRLGRLAVPQIYDQKPDYTFTLGKGICLTDGQDVTILATGLMVFEALQAAELLRADSISARVVDIHTIKPLDRDLVVECARQTGAIVTAEEHTVNGGLGSAVAEVLAEECPTPMQRVGVQDQFGRSGKPAELMAYYHLTAQDIADAARKAIAAKRS
mgnify:FL=1